MEGVSVNEAFSVSVNEAFSGPASGECRASQSGMTIAASLASSINYMHVESLG
jgi:hypothetical protein